MEKKHLIHFCMLSCMILFLNCTNMYDCNVFPSGNYQDLIDSQISELLNCDNKVFIESNLSLKKVRDIDCKSISIDMFLNNDYQCFPIYEINMKKFHLVDWSFFQKDTVLVHFKSDYVKKYLDNLITNRDKYVTKELTWDNKDKEIRTIALFNKSTGELEYDNILFNSFNIPSNISTLKQNLTRGEGDGASGYEEASIIETNGEFAKAMMTWSITGAYQDIITSISSGDTTHTLIFIPDMPIKNSSIEFSNNFPDQSWYFLFDDVTAFCGQYPDYKSYYMIKIGIGNLGFIISDPQTFDYPRYSYTGGYGYSYKSHF